MCPGVAARAGDLRSEKSAYRVVEKAGLLLSLIETNTTGSEKKKQARLRDRSHGGAGTTAGCSLALVTDLTLHKPKQKHHT